MNENDVIIGIRTLHPNGELAEDLAFHLSDARSFLNRTESMRYITVYINREGDLLKRKILIEDLKTAISFGEDSLLLPLLEPSETPQ